MEKLIIILIAFFGISTTIASIYLAKEVMYSSKWSNKARNLIILILFLYTFNIAFIIVYLDNNNLQEKIFYKNFIIAIIFVPIITIIFPYKLSKTKDPV